MFKHYSRACSHISRTLAYFYYKAYTGPKYIHNTISNILTKALFWTFDTNLNASLLYLTFRVKTPLKGFEQTTFLVKIYGIALVVAF